MSRSDLAINPMKTLLRLAALVLVSLLISACADDDDDDDVVIVPPPEPPPSLDYAATIERTQYGTAHITADSYGSLGFGQGYAFAEDRFCVLMDQIVKVRSQRSLYFGAGDEGQHIESDFAYLSLGVVEKAASMIATMSEDGRAMLHGYVAGYNQYLADTGVGNLPADCAAQSWVGPIDADSLMAYFLDIALLSGTRQVLPAIAFAQPPGASSSASAASTVPLHFGTASNGIAIGAEMAAGDHGLLLSNTHLPWEGELKYHEIHLTIPGEMDVAGISLSGTFGVLIGFNQSMAWTHTTSTSNQFIFYSLDLVPGQPTRYYYGEEQRDMEANTFAISVLQDDGSLVEQSRTLYRSHYGPMLDPTALGFPLSWDETTAYAIFDLNADNGRLLEPFLAMAKADSVIELREVFRTIGGVPWNNTMATDSSGQTFYADTTLVPNLSDAAESAFLNLLDTDLVTGIAFDSGLVLLDGSDPLFTVEQDPSATLAGAIPFSEAPQMLRQDFVANANDSYWLSNPDQPLTGYSVLYGDTETPRSLRTRLGLKQILESDSWTRQGLKDLLFANRSLSNEMWRDEFTTYCSGFTEALSTTGETVNIEQACIALTNWDGRYNLESHGAILNRELLSSASSTGLLNGQSYYAVPFDAQDAVFTPSGLSDAGKAYLLTQLADAVLRLESVGIALDAPLGDHQYTAKGSERIAIHGGLQHSDGAYNIAKYDDRTSLNSSLLPGIPRAEEVNDNTFLTGDGYLINYGASFIMAVEFTDDGPVAEAILSYSQSDDPDSDYFSDQTRLYSSKTWRPLAYSRAQIEADPTLTSTQVSN